VHTVHISVPYARDGASRGSDVASHAQNPQIPARLCIACTDPALHSPVLVSCVHRVHRELVIVHTAHQTEAVGVSGTAPIGSFRRRARQASNEGGHHSLGEPLTLQLVEPHDFGIVHRSRVDQVFGVELSLPNCRSNTEIAHLGRHETNAVSQLVVVYEPSLRDRVPQSEQHAACDPDADRKPEGAPFRIPIDRSAVAPVGEVRAG
jgi:hypothetical protein